MHSSITDNRPMNPRRNYVGQTNLRFVGTVDRIASAAYVIVMLPNDCASFAMNDAIEQIGKAGRLKGQVKKAVNDSLRAYSDYERQLRNALDGKQRMQLWLDLADEFHDRTQPHVEKFRLAVKQALDDRRIPDSGLRAHVLTADTLLRYAVVNFDRYFSDMARKYGADIRDIFRPARLCHVQSYWQNVTGIMCRVPKGQPDIDLNADPRCALAMRCIDAQFSLPENINLAAERALSLNPGAVPHDDDTPDLTYRSSPLPSEAPGPDRPLHDKKTTI